MFIRIVILLEALWNNFIVERLLLKQGHVGGEDLLLTSFDLVRLTVKLWTNKDRFADHVIIRSFDWMVSG